MFRDRSSGDHEWATITSRGTGGMSRRRSSLAGRTKSIEQIDTSCLFDKLLLLEEEDDTGDGEDGPEEKLPFEWRPTLEDVPPVSCLMPVLAF